jgi:ribosome-binding protein aMBF1 (putative translation factor)
MRVAAKLSQSDLATNVRMKPKYIQDIEACKALQNKADLAAIKRFLQKRVEENAKNTCAS